jgi:hypothetical protein
MAGDFTDLPVFDAFDAIAVISHASCTHQVTPTQVRRCWCPWPSCPPPEWPHRHRGRRWGALLVLVTTVTLAVF